MRTKLHLTEEMFQIEEDIIKTNKIFDKWYIYIYNILLHLLNEWFLRTEEYV